MILLIEIEVSTILLTKQNNLFEIAYIYTSVYMCGSVLAVPSCCLVERADGMSCHVMNITADYRSLS